MFSQDPPIRLARCSDCDHIYEIRASGSRALVAAYDADAPEESVLEALLVTQTAAYRRRPTRLTKVFGRAGRGLEVGSYVGGFLAAARDAAGLRRSGCERARSGVLAVERLRRRCRARSRMSTARECYDVVAIWNTFEQLYDSRAAVAAARRLLAIGWNARSTRAERRILRRVARAAGWAMAGSRGAFARAQQPARVSVSSGIHGAIDDDVCSTNADSRSCTFTATRSFRSPTNGRRLWVRWKSES